MKKIILVFLFMIFLTGGAWAMELKSEAFEEGRYIPTVHACQGQGRSPAIYWSDVPAGVKSFALVCEDPDAPFKVWIHWVVYNIAPEARNLVAGAGADDLLPRMTIEGVNDFGKIGYGGPCPPPGNVHRYVFRLFALDTLLASDKPLSRQELDQAIKGHVIAQAQLTGLFKR
jgi:hypothetical protein